MGHRAGHPRYKRIAVSRLFSLVAAPLIQFWSGARTFGFVESFASRHDGPIRSPIPRFVSRPRIARTRSPYMLLALTGRHWLHRATPIAGNAEARLLPAHAAAPAASVPMNQKDCCGRRSIN